MDAIQDVEHLCPHLLTEEYITSYYYPWKFIDSLYFAMTVTTTIGYGVLAPTLPAGRIMCMIYAIIGIPLTGMLLAWTSEFFGELLFKLFKSKLDKEKQNSKKVIAAVTLIYIAAGFVIFIFIPAVIFMTIENWTYLEGVYYCFITLTTIGFGDLATGFEVEGTYLYIYHVCVILWIMVGLGYWVMVANFITKALKSKKLQASLLRSAEEMKKVMHQMGIKNHDPTFLRQHSKATLNFMLQLSNIIAVQGGLDNSSISTDAESPNSPSPGTSTTSSGQFSPVSSPMGIPGISALFGPAMNRSNPLGQLIGPLGLNKYFFHPRRFSKECDLQQEELDMTVKLQALQAALAETLEGKYESNCQTPDQEQQCNETMANSKCDSVELASNSKGEDEESPSISEQSSQSISQSQVTLQLEDPQ
ncbi:hypothetical protein SK128_013851 [Halocaridina rubra]|uniref:Potassium channel domain-containing protein n=1 Tax=Halocaridina rubra TaxID=373956 RepID=A0AAN8XE87_HALRR